MVEHKWKIQFSLNIYRIIEAQKGTITMVTAKLVNMLGMQDRYDEILGIYQEMNSNIYYANLYHLPTIYAQLAIVYAKNKNAYSFIEYALYSYYLFVLTNQPFYDKFKNDMEEITMSSLDYCY